MVQSLKQRKQSGFTIIEVLIVLAIAGLILLVVFLAVPALQRNSRNTQRKNDVQNVVGALQEYQNNNSGKLPTTAALFTSDVLPNTKLGFYNNTGDVVYAPNAAAVASKTVSASTNVLIDTFTKCPATAPAVGATSVTTSGGTSRNVTAIYVIETPGGYQPQCLDM